MTEIAEEIRAGVRDLDGALTVWLERDYRASLEHVADALPSCWAPDGRCVELSPLGRGCVLRVEVDATDAGEAAAILDGWSARLTWLAEDVGRPGQLRLVA